MVLHLEKACTFRTCCMLPSPLTWERGLASNDGIPRTLPIRTVVLWQHEVLDGCSSEAPLPPGIVIQRCQSNRDVQSHLYHPMGYTDRNSLMATDGG
jgi:hypothetical protein